VVDDVAPPALDQLGLLTEQKNPDRLRRASRRAPNGGQ